MSSLATLIRMNRWKLQEQRRRLVEMEALARSFHDQMAALDERTRVEGVAAQELPEVAHALGGFVQASLRQRETLRVSLRNVEREIEAMHERVAAAFRELKRYELTDEKRRAAKRHALRRRDRIREDEIGVNIFRSKDGKTGPG